MFTISIGATFTSVLSRNNFTCFVLSNCSSIRVVSGRTSLYSCIKKAETILKAVKFYIQDMGSLKQNVPFLFALKHPSSFFLAVSPSRQIRKYKTMLKTPVLFLGLRSSLLWATLTTLSSRPLPVPWNCFFQWSEFPHQDQLRSCVVHWKYNL